MIHSFRIVTRIPLDTLWDEEGEVAATRSRSLSQSDLTEMLRKYSDLTEMLRKYPVEFYVADMGHSLRRVEVHKCYSFWKSEVKAHLVNDPDGKIILENYPGEYAYLASEWSGEIQVPIVLLEKRH